MSDTLKNLTDAALAIVGKEYETDPVPAAILAYASKREGKPVTKRDTDVIAAMFPGLNVTIHRDDWGTEICYYIGGHLGMTDGKPGFTDFVGFDDQRNEIRDQTLPGKRTALAELGIPYRWDSRHAIKIRQSKWSDPNGGSGVTRWPDSEQIQAWNQWAFGAREARNAERDQAVAYVAGPNDLARIAALVDELTCMAGELRGYLASAPSEVCRAARDALASAKLTLESD